MALLFLLKQHRFHISTAPTPSFQERTFMWWMKSLTHSKTKSFNSIVSVKVIIMSYLHLKQLQH